MIRDMPARVENSRSIHGVAVVHLEAFGDSRGRFLETYRRSWVPGAREMVQANRSDSRAGVLRGLHYHLRQADFWYVPSGRVRAALYDLRRSSPTHGASATIEMGEGREVGLYIPSGVAHGFVALADAVMTYLVDEPYDGTDELGILWNDPALGIDWGIADPLLSDRDRANPPLAAIPPSRLPR
jgi:dTDP-4-dehydrorhamnose 3,5-epimerase